LGFECSSSLGLFWVQTSKTKKKKNNQRESEGIYKLQGISKARFSLELKF
jgi:hypothetical protein